MNPAEGWLRVLKETSPVTGQGLLQPGKNGFILPASDLETRLYIRMNPLEFPDFHLSEADSSIALTANVVLPKQPAMLEFITHTVPQTSCELIQ